VRVLPTRIHGLLDYLLGMMLMALPWLLEFERGGPETITLTAAGTAIILYNMATDHELGLARLIPVPLHLVFDVVVATFLAAAPWMFRSGEIAPHLFFGVLVLGSAVLTHSTRKRALHLAW